MRANLAVNRTACKLRLQFPPPFELQPPGTSNIKHWQDMRAIVFVLFVAAKLAAIGLLPIFILGYLFFLNSHSVLTHLYVAVTLLGLLLTIAAAPRTFRSLRVVHGAAVVTALPLGCWKVHEQLSFYEGPAYDAAGMTGLAVAAIVVGFLAGRHLFPTGGNADV